jgi:hypothetical protein
MSTTQTQTETLVETAPVFAELNFYDPPATNEKPHNYMYSTDGPQRNFGDVTKVVPINDIRGHENEYSLDNNGFQIVKFSPTETEFVDEEKIKTQYYGEIEDLLKKVTGAYKVVIFDHTIRRAIPGQVDNPSARGPVGRVHIDQTPWAGAERVRLHTGDEAPELLKERVQIINVWRPINGKVEDHPLALADYRSVDWDNDLVPVALKYKHRDGETFSVKYSDNLKFYYKSGIDSDEAYLIKCYENKLDGRARLTPHTAFTDPRTPDSAKPRQSIEVRALVFYHEQI